MNPAVHSWLQADEVELDSGCLMLVVLVDKSATCEAAGIRPGKAWWEFVFVRSAYSTTQQPSVSL